MLRYKVMEKNVFIGIDVSKLNVTVILKGNIENVRHFQVSNNTKGFQAFIQSSTFYPVCPVDYSPNLLSISLKSMTSSFFIY